MTPADASSVNNKAPAPAAHNSALPADMFVDAKNENSNIMMNLQHGNKTRKLSDDCMEGPTGLLVENCDIGEGQGRDCDVKHMFKSSNPNAQRADDAPVNPTLNIDDAAKVMAHAEAPPMPIEPQQSTTSVAGESHRLDVPMATDID